MTAGEKYANVLKISKKKTYKAEDELGFGRNTLANAIKDNRELSEEYHNKFISHYGVNPIWWETEKGEVFVKNGTHNDKATDNNGKADPDKVLKTFIDTLENRTEYRLMPKVIMDDYKMVPKSIEEETNKRVYMVIDAKDEVIKELRERIAELKLQVAAAAAQKAT